MKGNVLFALVLTAVPCFSQLVSAELQAEALASCSVIVSEPLTPYGFAKTALVSLWYAKNAAERGQDIKKAAKETDNMFSFVTAMMRITKFSTNDFLCAKRSIRPFAAKETEENVRTGAEYFMMVYDDHININHRTIQLLKKLGSGDQADFMDEISTLQVEREQRWADLVRPTTLALLLMVDTNHTDVPGKTTRLIVTKAQQQTLYKWIDDHFPEFTNGTPKAQWSDPAKTAQMYFTIFDGRKCADE